jgi:RimJ/RimL family protein N-acetyltransferase
MAIVRFKGTEIPPLTKKRKAELQELAERPDSEIDLSEMPEWTDEQWARSVRMSDYPSSNKGAWAFRPMRYECLAGVCVPCQTSAPQYDTPPFKAGHVAVPA